MSIRGLYNADNTLFAEMSVCSEMSLDDKQTIVDNILMEYAELEVIYPDPIFMKHAIGAWSWKEVPTWDRIYAAAMAEYNPIENYNRTETASESTSGPHTEQGTGSETHSGLDSESRLMTNNETHGGTDSVTNSGTDTEAHSGTDTEAHSGIDSSTTSNTNTHTGTVTDANSGTDTLTMNRAAFDSSSLVTTGTDSTQHGHTLTKTFNETIGDSGSASVTHGESIGTTHGESIGTTYGHKVDNKHGETIGTDFEQTTDMSYGHKINQQSGKSGSDNSTVTRSSHISGNIGVTTSQQMLEQELVVSAKLNVYNYIMESFKNRFCLEVW